jgi:hypothetical protein
MRSLLSVTLIFALSALPRPAMAQEQERALGPIARSIAAHAARFGTSSSTESGTAARMATDSEWTRVQRLEPGTQITIVRRDSRVVRFFLASDDAGLTVLNRTDPLTRIFIPREDVLEIRKQPTRHVGSHTRRGALIGALAGGLLILAIAGSVEGSHDASEAWAITGFGALIGGLTGTTIGAFVGISVPESADLVYRAP